ncbi:glutaminase [Desulfitispora alkaliphila]|uniref:glutaminase A n=1 Tax=Desulfitispora alkaliphila TaxID=622674 RepID=UPI003D231DD5
MNLHDVLNRAIENNRKWCSKGNVATYIPELSKANPCALGVSLCTWDGKIITAGDCDTPFTLQSISKICSLILALQDNGREKVFSKVGMEPTGDPFNSIVKLETLEPSPPLNPMINAGAIAVTSLIKGSDVDERLERLLTLIRAMADNNQIDVDWEVYTSERETGNRNRAMAYFLKDIGIIDGQVEEALDLYFKQCAIKITCQDLARMGLTLATQGIGPCGEIIIDPAIAKLAKTFMVTCGMYNASGEFAIRVGIPAKSGVSGSILAAVPHRMGIGVIGPSLDKKGNSIAGVHLLEELSREMKLSIF